MDSTRSMALPAAAGLALLYAGATSAPGATNFLTPSGQGLASSSASVNGAAASNPADAPASSTGGLSGAAAVAACGMAATAGLAAVRRKRTAMGSWPGYGKAEYKPGQVVFGRTKGRYDDLMPELVIDWQVEPKIPEPGSEKMFNSMVGADVEIGDGENWDPMGFTKLYDRNFDFNMVMTYPHVQWLREAEVKHGRICMLAFVGMVVQQFVQIPGYPAEPDWTKALAACLVDRGNMIGMGQIIALIFFIEGRFSSHDAWIGQMDREPGDLGFDPLKLSKRKGFDLKSKQLSELKNGRLAMIGVASMAANHAIPGSVPFLTGAYAVKPEATATVDDSSAFCGSTRLQKEARSKTAAKYTTQVILPALTWLKTGIKAADLAPTQLIAKVIGGNDVLVGKDESGTIFCVANLCPHIGTPMSEGADVIGDTIVCPLHGSSFSTKTGDLIDWCVSPPIIGPLTGIVVEKKNLLIFESRTSFFGGDIEVLVDTNAKRAYEADYWKGILDAQGKNDGTYY